MVPKRTVFVGFCSLIDSPPPGQAWPCVLNSKNLTRTACSLSARSITVSLVAHNLLQVSAPHSPLSNSQSRRSQLHGVAVSKKCKLPCFCTTAVGERPMCEKGRLGNIFTSTIQLFYSSNSSSEQFIVGLYHLRRPLEFMAWQNSAKFWKNCRN